MWLKHVTAISREHALLIVMTTTFAALALDIAVPAAVLSVMAVCRWLFSPPAPVAGPMGDTA
jgi:hypothetical protein